MQWNSHNNCKEMVSLFCGLTPGDFSTFSCLKMVVGISHIGVGELQSSLGVVPVISSPLILSLSISIYPLFDLNYQMVYQHEL